MRHFFQYLFCIGILSSVLACSSSPEEKAKKEIAKSLGIDKKKLDSESYYHFKMESGPLKGKEFTTPTYSQGGIGSTWDAGKTLTKSDISFIDPLQGSTTFCFRWTGKDITPIAPDKDPFSKNSFIELKVKVDEVQYTYLAEQANLKVKSLKEVSKLDQITKEHYPQWDLELEYDGVFKEMATGEVAKIKGMVKGVTRL
ncbi:hypothetical protein ACFSKL_21350 [Belliella marina]|uniref:Lipoprotein n=1 Tax=Belliella marina TaxID=1644146 RepID=A0ABW4VT65_9BACT